jgi:translation initiation factor IF-3
VPEVRLVGPAGEQVGILSIGDALRLAQEADLDLVEVAPMARPPVCKLMDYGKFKYESALKARESRKNQAQTVIKEIKLRPKIDPHDYGTKKGHVERFLKAGDKVKVTIMFRGREQSRPELGFKLLQRLAADVEDLGFVESVPKQDGRNMIMVIGPHRRKTEALAAARAERASKSGSRAPAGRGQSAAVEGSAPGDQADEGTTRAAPRASQTTAPARAADPGPAEPASAAPARPSASAAQPRPRPPASPAAPAAPRPQPPASAAPAGPRPRPAGSGGAAPRPAALRTPGGSATRPAAAPAPRPTAPRGTTAAGRSAAAGGAGAAAGTAVGAARPGPARRPAASQAPSRPAPVGPAEGGSQI